MSCSQISFLTPNFEKYSFIIPRFVGQSKSERCGEGKQDQVIGSLT